MGRFYVEDDSEFRIYCNTIEDAERLARARRCRIIADSIEIGIMPAAILIESVRIVQNQV